MSRWSVVINALAIVLLSGCGAMATPTAAPTPTPPPTATPTPLPTATMTPSPTKTPIPTPTATPSPRPTSSPTPVPPTKTPLPTGSLTGQVIVLIHINGTPMYRGPLYEACAQAGLKVTRAYVSLASTQQKTEIPLDTNSRFFQSGLRPGVYRVSPLLEYVCPDGQSGRAMFYWVSEANVVVGQTTEWSEQTPLQVHCPPLPWP